MDDVALVGVAIICAASLAVVVSVFLGLGKNKSPATMTAMKTERQMSIGYVDNEMENGQKIQVMPSQAKLAPDEADILKPLNDILARWSGRKHVSHGSGSLNKNLYQVALDECVLDLTAAMEKIELILRGEK